MEYKQIQQVLEISKTASFSKAAQNLYISQPNLSVSIKNLEEEIGEKIFTRTTKGVELTDFGKQFISYLSPIYKQLEAFDDIIKDIKNEKRLIFSMSTNSLKFVYNIFIDIYNKYKEEKIDFTYNETSNMEILQDVENRKSQFGIILFSSYQKKTILRLIKIKNLEYNVISIEKPYVIVGNKNPLYNKQLCEIDINMLNNYTFVAHNEDIFYDILKEFHYLNENKILISNRACLYDMLSNTDAFSICTNNKNAYKDIPAYNNIKVIPIKNTKFNFEIGWVKAKNYETSNIVNEFIEKIYKICGSK